MHVRLQLELPADARMLPRTRWALLGYLAELGASEDTTGDVILALDEACANVIRHAFPTGEPGTFRLAADLTDEEVVFEVEDSGVGFDACEPRTGIELEATSGRGLGIMRRVMTSVEVESPRPAGGTRVLMRKRLNSVMPPPPSGGIDLH